MVDSRTELHGAPRAVQTHRHAHAKFIPCLAVFTVPCLELRYVMCTAYTEPEGGQDDVWLNYVIPYTTYADNKAKRQRPARRVSALPPTKAR